MNRVHGSGVRRSSLMKGLGLGLLVCLAAGASAVSPAYRWDAGESATYRLNAVFDGFLPLLGGNEGRADVVLGVRVVGEAAAAPLRRATTEVTEFSLSFNGARLPFGVEAVRDFFPKAGAEFKPQGEVTKNEAPKRSLPVRLPGLAADRLPEITYLPIQFPAGPVEQGATWEFSRDFDGVPLKTSVTWRETRGDLAMLDVKIQQSYSVLENEVLEVVAEESQAIARTQTELSGSGVVWFSLKDGRVEKADIKSVANSVVTPLKGGQPTNRRLTTTYAIERVGFAGVPGAAPTAEPAAAPPLPAWQEWGMRAADFSGQVSAQARGWFALGLMSWRPLWQEFQARLGQGLADLGRLFWGFARS